MFGSKPGEERFRGTLNQFVVSKLSGPDKSYWVFHTRGEEAVSILIGALTAAKVNPEDLISLVRDLHAQMLGTLEWSAVKVQQESGLVVYAWGSKDTKINLHKIVEEGTAVSRVLGYEKGANEELKD